MSLPDRYENVEMLCMLILAYIQQLIFSVCQEASCGDTEPAPTQKRLVRICLDTVTSSYSPGLRSHLHPSPRRFT